MNKKYIDTSEPRTSDPHKLKPLQSTMSSRSQIRSNKSRCRLVGDLVNQHCFVDVGNRNIIVRLTIENRIKKWLVVVIKRNFIIRWYLYPRIWTLKKVSTTEEGFFCKNTKKKWRTKDCIKDSPWLHIKIKWSKCLKLRN